MSTHHVDHQQYSMQQAHFTAPHQHQPQHPNTTQQSNPASPQPPYYQAAQDHVNGYTNNQTYVGPQQAAYAGPSADMQQPQPPQPQPGSSRPSMVPAQSITQETYQSPVVAQPGSDWAKDLIRLARSSELKKHSLTLQLHTAHILSAHSSLEQRNKKLEDVRSEKNWLESERARLLDCLREVNEDREKVDLSESALLKEVTEFKNQIKAITDGEYGAAKKEVDAIRAELEMPPLPSLQATLEEKSARGFVPHTTIFGVTDTGPSHTGSSANKRRAGQSSSDSAVDDEETPATVPSPISRPSLYSVAQTNGTTPVKRGPGRPRKVPASDSPAPVASGDQDGEPPAKRPRGRPKGSKNKPKVAPPPETAAAEAQAQ
ncbi:hypothetical protein BDV93DRAFT_519652 [Ceratobasidium sp. AG-I]|nr:hypothetical protein BDV93DRAFT_519652 [Ceratobasidium sp. AG-I]